MLILLEEVAKNVEVDIPEEMVQEEVDNLKHRMEHEMSHQGLTLDLYYQFTGTTEEDLNAQLEKEAYKNTLYRLMLEEIKNKEKIEATDKEAKDEAKKQAERYQMDVEEFTKQIGGLDGLKYDIAMNKTVDLLKELNKA